MHTVRRGDHTVIFLIQFLSIIQSIQLQYGDGGGTTGDEQGRILRSHVETRQGWGTVRGVMD